MFRALTTICFVKATTLQSEKLSTLSDAASATTYPGASINLKDPVIESYTLYGMDLHSDAQIIELFNEPTLYEPLANTFGKNAVFNDGNILFINKNSKHENYRVDLFCFDSNEIKYGHLVQFLNYAPTLLNGVYSVSELLQSMQKELAVKKVVEYCGLMKLRREYLNDLLKTPALFTAGPFMTERLLVVNMFRVLFVNPVLRGTQSEVPTRVIYVD